MKSTFDRQELWLIEDAIQFYVARSTCKKVDKINKTRYKILGMPQPNDPLAKHCSHLGEWGEPLYKEISRKILEASRKIDEETEKETKKAK